MSTIDQFEWIARLCPLHRDLISDGYDEALHVLANDFPLRIHEYQTGMPCWTWRIPSKWSCQEAFVETLDGRRVIDASADPLNVNRYSQSIDRVVSKAELLEHLHFHPHVDRAPFIFHYYNEDWGFGCRRSSADALVDAEYRVVIRSRHEPGALKVGEWHLPGNTDETIVLAAHLDHPCQANDGLSGVITGLSVMQSLASKPRRYSYRFLITAETIGSVAWLSHHEDLIPNIHGGLFLDMTGLRQPPALQLSYRGNTQIDACFRHVHLAAEQDAWTAPYRGVVGNDERQFNAPGVRIPMLSYSRALPWGHPDRPYREYHSSADDLTLVCPEKLEHSRATIVNMLEVFEANLFPHNRFRGEVCLSAVNLAVDRHRQLGDHRMMLKVMDRIDGTESIVEIAEALATPFDDVKQFVDQLADRGLCELFVQPDASSA